MFDSLERLKHRIHNFRAPIKNPKVLFLVQCLYFFAPLAAGYGIMVYTTPNPDDMRSRLKLPTPEEQAVINAHKRKLQDDMDAALSLRQQQQQEQKLSA